MKKVKGWSTEEMKDCCLACLSSLQLTVVCASGGDGSMLEEVGGKIGVREQQKKGRGAFLEWRRV